ncbi:MAG: hypothetical protein IT160_01500 [Bryobacterales bacterium]|nr:hypothetical protein [Bryobacterales bacterium]
MKRPHGLCDSGVFDGEGWWAGRSGSSAENPVKGFGFGGRGVAQVKMSVGCLIHQKNLLRRSRTEARDESGAEMGSLFEFGLGEEDRVLAGGEAVGERVTRGAGFAGGSFGTSGQGAVAA